MDSVKKLVPDQRLKIRSWNIKVLTMKSREVVDVMIRRARINNICLQDMRCIVRWLKYLLNRDINFSIHVKFTIHGVWIIMSMVLKDKVIDVKRLGDKVMVLRILQYPLC